MLSLQPPFLESGNLMLFRDDTVDTTFYYACQQPRISRDENGEPMISAYSILPESGADLADGAILEAGLNVDIDLAPTPEELSAAREAIQKHFGVDAQILSPVPLHGGKVRFLMAQQGSENDAGKRFVTSDIQPSLMGSNKASLAIRTSGRDAKLLIAAAGEGEVSACIYYELDLIGITPVFHARMTADLKRVYHYMREFSKDNFFFFSDEVETLLQEMSDKKEFSIEIEETDPDIKAEALKTLLNELKSQVIQTLFTQADVLTPTPREKEGFITRWRRAILPNRLELKTTIDDELLQSFSVDLSQKNAKTYRFCPQALLRSMIDSAGVDMTSRITWIKLDDLPYFSQTVSVRIAPDTFNASNINTVVVSCRVVEEDSGQQVMEPQTQSFTAKDGKTAWDFNFNRKKGVGYRYEYKATMYMTTDSNRLPDKMEMDWRQAEGSYIYINPAEYYRDFELDINLNDTSVLEHVQMVQVDVSVTAGTDEVPVLQRTFIFSQEQREHRRLALVAGRDLDLKYSMRLTYYLPGEREHVAEYRNINDTYYFIPNPFENRWSVDLHCQADWEKCAKVYLDTRFTDAEKSDPVVGHFIFSQDHTEDRLQAACSVNTPSRIFQYQVSVLGMDGSLVKGGWYSHGDTPVLMLHANTQKEETVYRICFEKPAELTRLGVKTIGVDFRITGVDGEETIEHRDVTQADTVMEFPAPTKGECAVKYNLKSMDGESFRSKWQKLPAEDFQLVIPDDIW